MDTVVIGMDPHKRSATIEVMTSDEAVRAENLVHGSDQRGCLPGVLP
jgi:hypothetical protein